jgi:hypothetical protein
VIPSDQQTRLGETGVLVPETGEDAGAGASARAVVEDFAGALVRAIDPSGVIVAANTGAEIALFSAH